MNRIKPLFSWRGAICDSDLPPITRLVALTLSLHMNERGGSCFPSVTTLQRETGLSRNAVLKALRSLETAGWLTVKRTARRVNVYTATVPPGAPHAPAGAPHAPALARHTRPNSSIELSTNNYVPPPDPTRTQEAALRLVAPEDR